MGAHDWRPLTNSLGATTRIKFDADGQIVIRTEGDAAPVLDMNHALRGQAADDGGAVSLGGLPAKRVASIPPSLQVKWLVEEGLDIYNPEHSERLMRKLNDPDYAYLRTAPGCLALLTDGESFR